MLGCSRGEQRGQPAGHHPAHGRMHLEPFLKARDAARTTGGPGKEDATAILPTLQARKCRRQLPRKIRLLTRPGVVIPSSISVFTSAYLA